MSLEITTRVEGGFGFMELVGKLTLSPDLQRLRQEARTVLSSQPVQGLILLVSDITAVDSAGLGELTIVYSLSAKKGCRMELVGVNPTFRKSLEITRLDAILTASTDIESAKRKLAQSSSRESHS